MTSVRLGTAPLHPRVAPYAQCPVLAVETETTGPDWWNAGFRYGGWVLYEPTVGADYIGVRHETKEAPADARPQA